ncbi:MAG: glucose-6-phosphate dehydrogenase, partial [Actinomycetota bacterium]
EDLRDETAKVLRAADACRPDWVVRGQYDGYRDEPDVQPDSEVETFVAIRVDVDNWRWAGVPFFLRTGKRLPRKISEATVVFKPVPLQLFDAEAGSLPPNRVTLRLQPDEGISISFLAQRPGLGTSLEETALEFEYGEAFADIPLVGAYEHLLFEAMHGDRTLFTRQDGVERAWEVLDRVLREPPAVRPYAPGSWGPSDADELIAPRRWLTT